MQPLLILLLIAVSITTSSARTVHYASCALGKTDTHEVVGTVDLKEEGDSGVLELHLQVTGSELNLEPNSKHGFHVHTYGSTHGGCGSTGGHYNPAGVNHSAPSSSVRHVGDLGNVEADGSGDIDVRINDTVASLLGSDAIIGRAFVLHAGEDDLGTGGNAGSLASGNAGSRLACCVIGWASGSDWTNP